MWDQNQPEGTEEIREGAEHSDFPSVFFQGCSEAHFSLLNAWITETALTRALLKALLSS